LKRLTRSPYIRHPREVADWLGISREIIYGREKFSPHTKK
jgi:hypothetical protein